METTIYILIAVALTGVFVIYLLARALNKRQDMLDNEMASSRAHTRTERDSLWEGLQKSEARVRDDRVKLSGLDYRLAALEHERSAQNKEAKRAALKDKIRKEILDEKASQRKAFIEHGTG